MKRFGKILLALTLGLALLFGETAAVNVGFDGAPVRAAAETFSAPAVRAGSADAGRTALSAKSKKKNTAAPTEAASPTPGVDAVRKQAGPTATPVPEGPIIDPQSIADYLFSHDMRLPDNFITKREAQALGWDRSNNVSDVAPGKSIGGDHFGNYEGRLPVGKGIQYREADCWYTGGRRNAYRVIYSTDGRVWYTEDHYETFTELFPTVP